MTDAGHPPTMDINADLGEGFAVYQYGADEEILPLITSANIAAGFHASDPVTLGRTVDSVLTHGVRAGAHVGYPDRLGFGRRSMQISEEDAYAYALYQIGAVRAFVEAKGGDLTHVKPHGAMYMDACHDPALARGIVRAVAQASRELEIYTLPGSCVAAEAADLEVPVRLEFFADRPYSGPEVQMFGWTMMDIGTPQDAAARTLAHLATTDADIRTVCVHSDTPGSPAILAAVKQALAGKDFLR